MVSLTTLLEVTRIGRVFIDIETHENGVTKCMTSVAFSWHHSSAFQFQGASNQVLLFLSWKYK